MRLILDHEFIMCQSPVQPKKQKKTTGFNIIPYLIKNIKINKRQLICLISSKLNQTGEISNLKVSKMEVQTILLQNAIYTYMYVYMYVFG